MAKGSPKMILQHLLTVNLLSLIVLSGASLLEDSEAFEGDYLDYDSDVDVPNSPPDVEHTLDSYHVALYKVYKDKTHTTCSYQIVHMSYLRPTKEKDELFSMKTNCRVGNPDYPLENVVKVVDKDSALIKLQESNCLKVTVKWDEAQQTADVKESCQFKCSQLQDHDCPGDDLSYVTSYDEQMKTLFGQSTQLWDKDELRDKISIRLVSKSWTPTGQAAGTDLLDVYKGSVDEAFTTLSTTPEYRYVEALMTDNNAQELLTMKNTDGVVEYDKSLPTIMILHPLSGYGSVNFVKVSITALAMRNVHRHYNIFAVDMPATNLNMLMSILRNTMGEDPKYGVFAEAIGEFFKGAIESGMMKPSEIHLIGYSYTGQLVGYLARYIKTLTKTQIPSIIALDPLGPRGKFYVVHVSAADAKIVHTYHSNSFPCGTMQRVATADFTFNNGFLQKECIGSPIATLCSHKHVVLRFWYVILYGPTLFKARQCDSVLQFNAGLCDSNPTAFMTYPIGDNPAKGKYFIRTLDTMPYGMGEKGAVCDQEMKQKITTSLEESKTTKKNPYDLQMFLSLMDI